MMADEAPPAYMDTVPQGWSAFELEVMALEAERQRAEATGNAAMVLSDELAERRRPVEASRHRKGQRRA